MLGYSLVFPITNLIGGDIAAIGIVLSIPFLPMAWGGGVYLAMLMGEGSFLLGAFLSILLQVWIVLLLYTFFRPHRLG
jgi:hypothetical protein